MNISSKITFLEQFPIFDVLTNEELMQLGSMVDLKKRPKYAYIYSRNDPSDYIYFLLKGTIKIVTHSNDEKEVIKSVLHPLSMFGELCIVGQEERTDYAKAMNQEVHYFSLKLEDLRKVMRNNHRLSNKILFMMGERLHRVESRLESLIFKDARTRIIDFIKDSAEKRGRRIGIDETLVKHSLTQQDIANITGTSRQTVTSVLNDLKKSNLIHFTRKSILIRDMMKLA